MSNTRPADPVADAQNARERGVDRLRQLREQQAQLRAEQDTARADLDRQVAAADAEFSAAEADRQHTEQITTARQARDDAHDAYTAAAATADKLIIGVRDNTDALITAFLTAREAEAARLQAGSVLRQHQNTLAALGEPTGQLGIEDERLRLIPASDPVAWIARAALAHNRNHPALRGLRVPPPPLAFG